MHRVLDSLEAAIARPRIPREVPFLRAERAVAYARLGDADRARREIADLRASPEGKSPLLTAWLWLAEGLADYFENLGPRARDRVHRATALAASLKATRVHALAAAWLAHMDLWVHDYPAIVRNVSIALQLAAPDHHAARWRACTVIACCYHYAGREDLAHPWYLQARFHAATEGDAASLSSITYNIAVYRVMEVRLIECFGQTDQGKTNRAMLWTESSICLDQSLRTQALSNHSPMQRALVLVAQGKFAEALELYERYMDDALKEGMTRSECQLQADRAWCLLQVGRSDDALMAARAAESSFLYATEPEEQAMAHSVLATVYERLGLPDVARTHAGAAQRMYGVYQFHCQELLAILEDAQLERVRMKPEPSGVRTAPC